jgi:hypothetical protein
MPSADDLSWATTDELAEALLSRASVGIVLIETTEEGGASIGSQYLRGDQRIVCYILDEAVKGIRRELQKRE